MDRDKRTKARRPLSFDGRLYKSDGSSLCDCHLHDVSEQGARIEVTKPEDVPDKIILALSRDGLVRRRSEVVWRTENELGVHFIAE